MNRKTTWIALLSIVALLCAVVAVAASNPPPVQIPIEDDQPGDGGSIPLVDIPIDDDCHAACCAGSGGVVDDHPDGSLTCHVDDDDPNLPLKLAMFHSCAEEC
jgi:hypothetical protein